MVSASLPLDNTAPRVARWPVATLGAMLLLMAGLTAQLARATLAEAAPAAAVAAADAITFPVTVSAYTAAVE